MTELLLKLIGPVIPVVAALIQLGRESGWLGRGTLRGQRWAFVLIGTIILGGFINSAMTWNTHENEKNERENDERASEEREQQAQKERQEIAEGIGKIELALGREPDPDLPVQDALVRIGSEVQTLQERASKLGDELGGLRKYGRVSELNVKGVTGKYGKGMVEKTPISRKLEGAYTNGENDGESGLQPRCDKESMAKFEQVAREHPNFPFAYWGLASCLGQVGNVRASGLAVMHAKRAMEILEHTTQIDGHHPNHDQVRKAITQGFREACREDNRGEQGAVRGTSRTTWQRTWTITENPESATPTRRTIVIDCPQP